jgi:hypothetical protein
VARPGERKREAFIDKNAFKKMQALEKGRRFGRWNGASLEGRDF